ncbi:MAG: transposase [Methanobrevibacter sp.]|jgi:transposase|nr:transposase [Methanobrevibacter sp.]
MRWRIEEIFKFLKQNLKLSKFHGYTKRSIYKNAYLNVLLLGIIISEGIEEI